MGNYVAYFQSNLFDRNDFGVFANQHAYGRGGDSFWIASLFMPREPVTKRDLLLLFVASLFGITLNQGFFVLGLSYTTPIDASVVASLAPIITMILAAFIQKEPMTGKKVVGVFMGLSGALMLILNGAGTVSEGLSGGRVMGDLFCLVAEISFAIYYVAFKGLISRYTPVTLMKWMFLFSAICCLPLGGNDLLSIPYSDLSGTIYLDLFLSYSVLHFYLICWFLSDKTFETDYFKHV